MNYIEVYQYGKLVWSGLGNQLPGMTGYGCMDKQIEIEENQVLDFCGYGLLVIETKIRP